jgi:hypothetical protein
MGKLAGKNKHRSIKTFKEYFEEGIATELSMLGKAAQTVGRGAVGLTKEVGKALMPHTAAALGKIGQAASSALVKVAAENPKLALKNFLTSARGRRRFKNIKLGSEGRQPNNDAEISFKGEVYDESQGLMKPVTGFFIVRPTDEKENNWQVVEATLDDYPDHIDRTVIWSGERHWGRGSNLPNLSQPPVPSRRHPPTPPPATPGAGGSGPPSGYSGQGP